MIVTTMPDIDNAIFPQLSAAEVDLRRDAPVLSLLVYFMIGCHDVNGPSALTRAGYRLRGVRHKELTAIT
jgi:hypothetical protein